MTRSAYTIGRRAGAVILATAAAIAPVGAQSVRVESDARAEVMGIMFRIAGAPEWSDGRVLPYIKQIDSAFGPWKNHAVIREIQELCRKNGVSFDAVMSMAAHITDPVTFGERSPFDAPSSTLDRRWHGADARPFLRAARDFVRDAHVAEFLQLEKPIYDSAAARMRRLITTEARVEWFNAFFGEQSGGVFIASPLLVNANGNVGPRYDDAQTHEMYAYMGTARADSLGFPTISSSLLPTLVHEFNHSFVNRVVETRSSELAAAGERIFRTAQAAMRSQAYGNWQTMFNESVVRASVIRYLLANIGRAAADQETRSQRAIGFVWMDELVALLGEYEADRARYPTLTSFMPRVVTFYNDLSPRIERVTADFDRNRPSIAGASVANGAKDVDPTIGEITVRFDRPMGPGISMNPGNGGDFPDVTSYSFDADHMSFSLRVKLVPNHDYAIRYTGFSFASADGFPLKEFVLRFHTR